MPGNGKFTPRWAIGYLLDAQVSCNPGGMSDLASGRTGAIGCYPFQAEAEEGTIREQV